VPAEPTGLTQGAIIVGKMVLVGDHDWNLTVTGPISAKVLSQMVHFWLSCSSGSEHEEN
jgi:hypothetical protein